MPEKNPRPLSVIVTQIILLALGLIWGVLSLFNLFAIFTSASGALQRIVNILLALVLVLFAGVFLTGFWGLVKRRRYGRWIGVGGLTLILISAFTSNFVRPSGPLEYYEYRNSAELAGGILGSIVIYTLILLLIYRLAKGDAANTFFESPESVHSEPPPPPSFESVK